MLFGLSSSHAFKRLYLSPARHTLTKEFITITAIGLRIVRTLNTELAKAPYTDGAGSIVTKDNRFVSANLLGIRHVPRFWKLEFRNNSL